MRFKTYFILCLTVISVLSCKEDPEPSQANQIPEGSTPFTDSDILFVPYTSQSPVYKDQSDNTLTLNFTERKRTEEYFAWDQTYLTFSSDETLEVEMRLRYLQSDVSKKTLALYMPYYDNSNTLRNNLFEMPIDPTGLETGFFKNIINYYDTLAIDGSERYDVFEVNELVNTDADKEGAQNYSKIYYNREYGILQMRLKDGVIWSLQ